jgi:hypothetical protein
MILAWMKLRKRNLAPILDANGWAVNAKAKMNVPFGASLTGVASLPDGAMIGGNDKFGEKPSAWPGIIKFVVIVCFTFSLLRHYGVVDMIAYKTTGQHYEFFKSADDIEKDKKKSAEELEKDKAKNKTVAAETTTAVSTNAVAAPAAK